jgi:hypothetical protein
MGKVFLGAVRVDADVIQVYNDEKMHVWVQHICVIRRVKVACALHKPNPITNISNKQGAPFGVRP